MVNFKNTLIIMPSNIGSHDLSRALAGIIQEIFEGPDRKNLEEVIEKMRVR